MKFFGYFWLLFFLYFAFAHPAIIYYNIPRAENLADKDPQLALFYLLLAIVGWTLVVGVMAYGIYRIGLGQQKKIHQLLESGRQVTATIRRIISSKPIGKEWTAHELLLSFRNFAKEEVTYQLSVNDSKPEQRRYDVEKKIRLRIDDSLQRPPYILPEDTQVKMNRGLQIGLWIVWLLFTLALIYGFSYIYQLENDGYGWRFLTIYHPIFISLAMTIGGTVLIYFVFFRFLPSKSSGIKRDDSIRLLLYGERTVATVVSAAQTGLRINDQPQIKFNLSYTDNKGNTHYPEITKIVNLMDLADVKQPQRGIFYLRDEPDVVAFEEDIQA